ncbi:MAG: flagellar biosynthesis protein FlhA [Frankiales bacterium]|jgi:flagellar biosynthesis protein FlhA|nr:flagellar biosynthesis protein FlhA [Frankiales bacterium]
MTTPAVRGSKSASIGVPAVIIGVVIMMVVPLPAMLLDMLLAVNLALAVVILLTAVMAGRALDFSVFPALLLVTTLLRLALNISSTRLILLHGEAGKVIEAFGHVVIGGSLVVGLVVFLILVIVQFLVITAGAGRVSEVAARFTLDAMPGKQMAIDADLNSGLIDDEQAKQRRLDVGREADFFGSMDGASKFVKGDAIAGIIIVAINLIGGFAIGVLQQGMAMGEAIQRYALLSVGDGLVSQVPALLISVASGIIVTRVQSDDDDGGLGDDLIEQLTRSTLALRIAAVSIAVLGLMPGLPKLPFFALAAVLAFLATRKPKAEAELVDAPQLEEGGNETPEVMLEQVRVEPLELELAPDLLDLLDPARGGSLMDRVRALRKRIASDLGLVVPPVRTRDAPGLPMSTYVVKLHGIEAARGEAPPGHSMVLGDDATGLPGRATVDPVFGLPATWVQNELAEVLAAEGSTVIDRASVIVTHLSEVVRSAAPELLTRQDVQTLVDAVKTVSPVVAAEVGGETITLAEVQRVLRDLLSEKVPVRDLTRILEAVTARARETRQPEALVEAARSVLGATISSGAAVAGRIAALTLEPLLEQSLLEAVRPGETGSWLALDPTRMEMLVQGIGDAVRQAEAAGHRPAVVCSAQLRPAVRRLLATGRPDLPVLSYTELSRTLIIEPVGVIVLAQRAAA